MAVKLVPAKIGSSLSVAFLFRQKGENPFGRTLEGNKAAVEMLTWRPRPRPTSPRRPRRYEAHDSSILRPLCERGRRGRPKRIIKRAEKKGREEKEDTEMRVVPQPQIFRRIFSPSVMLDIIVCKMSFSRNILEHLEVSQVPREWLHRM